jgi:hypothetical protein
LLSNLSHVRKLKTSVVVSMAMLAAAHAFGALEASPTRNLQTAEAQAQETVDLTISGMV